MKAAYHAKAKELHPDVNRGQQEESAALMAQVTEAYGVLSDGGKRRMYDVGVADLVLNERETDLFSSVVTKSL